MSNHDAKSERCEDIVESMTSSVSAAAAMSVLDRPYLWQRIFRTTSFMIGASVLVIIISMAIFAPLIAPDDPYKQDLPSRLSPPFWHKGSDPAHPLGTDKVGRDYLSRLIYGARISLLVGFSVMLISGIIGSIMGILAGYFGGRVDMVITFIINVRLAMPIFLIAMSVVVMFGASLKVVILTLGLFMWDQFVVVMRSTTMQIRQFDFVAAARAVGCSTLYLLLCEIMPNIFGTLTVVATVEMPNAILLEAALSFLGFGVQPPLPSWGLMLSSAREFMFFSPWLVAIPGCALFILILAINLFGDGLRDVTYSQGES